MNKNNIIKINGQHYDANTGKPLHVAKTALISDIKSTSSHNKPANRKPAASIKSHAPQSSKTLMRGPLKKPSSLQGGAQHSKSQIIPKLSLDGINHDRFKHAKAIPKSKLISHFNDSSYVSSPETIIISPTDRLVAEITNARLNPEYKPDFLQSAIDHATSHEQPPHKLKKSKKVKITKTVGITASVMILVGIVGYQNISNLRLRMATSHAGFAASLPAYHATGFSLSDIKSNPGEVAINFSDKNNISKNYTVVEKPSNWDSVALRDNFVSLKDKNYRTLETNGQLVYLYGNNNASWVNANIWYVVTGNGTLSDTQIINLVVSL